MFHYILYLERLCFVILGIVVVAAEAVEEEAAAVASPTLLDIDQAANNSELIELRVQLDRERGLRMILEDQVRSLETQLYPERIREITQQVQLQFQQHQQEVSVHTVTTIWGLKGHQQIVLD